MRRLFQLDPHFDIHTYIHTYLHADRQTDRHTHTQTHTHTHTHSYSQTDGQTDRHTWVSARMHARMHGRIRANIQTSKLEVGSKKLEVRSKKLEIRSKKLESRGKKWEIRKFTDCHIYKHVHTHTHKHAHTQTPTLPNPFHCSLTSSGHSQTFRIPVSIEIKFVLNSYDTLQANASVCDIFWRLTDFKDLAANRVKPCFYLLGPTQNHSISLRHFLDIHRLPGFRCQYSLTCLTTCADCSN